jgi:hypothetical protein
LSSDKQIAANVLNAQRSTGPRTPSGKAKISANALRHGLTGQDVVLPGEKPDDFDSFRAGLLTSLDPQNDLEAALVEKIVADLWRLRRVPIFEALLYRRGCAELLVGKAEASLRQYETTDAERRMALLQQTEVAAHDRRVYEEANRKLASARTQLDDPSFNITRVLGTSPEPFLNLWRHETALSRSLQRTLHELERLQAKRAGQHVPVPAIVDVDVSLPDLSVDIGRTDPDGETDGNQR